MKNITDAERIAEIKRFLSLSNIDQFPQEEIRSAVWHILDTNERSVVTGLLGGAEDAIKKGYKL